MCDDPIERPDLFGYAVEKLAEAVTALATDPSDVKGRLWTALPALALIPPEGLPARLREKWEALWTELTRNPDGEPKFGARFRRAHLKTLGKLAERIYSLAAEAEYCFRERQREA